MEYTLERRKIIDLVDENYTYASVLHTYGIEFYRYSELTLAQVCRDRSLNLSVLLRQLQEVSQPTQSIERRQLADVPVDVVIEYLRHTHHIFIKRQLPYMAKLIRDIQPEHFDQPDIAVDLKFIFPLFMEDFIEHIHQEEDVLFDYVLKLKQAAFEPFDAAQLFYEIGQCSLEEMSNEHAEDDDEMEGIRLLTNNYAIGETTGTYTKVVYSELRDFQQQLAVHSCIENEILFPKAISLEKRVKLRMVEKARLN
jgi:regulator of cell morphogenesis and NO signaling